MDVGDLVFGALREAFSWLWPLGLLVALMVVWCVRAEPPGPTVDDLLARADAEKPTVRDPEPETGRRCFCPVERWDQWRKGAVAGPDQLYGTADDITLEKKSDA